MRRVVSLLLLLAVPALAQQGAGSLGRLFEADHVPQEWLRALDEQASSNKQDAATGSFDWSSGATAPTAPTEPAAPAAPTAPAVPAVPAIPAIPAIPSVGGGIPPVPAIPTIPTIPAIPSIPPQAQGNNKPNKPNGKPGRMLQQLPVEVEEEVDAPRDIPLMREEDEEGPHDVPLKGPSPNPANQRSGDFSFGSFDWNPLDHPLPTPLPLPDAEWVIRCILLGSDHLALEDPAAVAANVQQLLQSLAGYQGDISVDLSSLAPTQRLRGSSANAVTLKDAPVVPECVGNAHTVYLAIQGNAGIDPAAAQRAIEDNSFGSVFTVPTDYCATKFIQFQPVPFRR